MPNIKWSSTHKKTELASNSNRIENAWYGLGTKFVSIQYMRINAGEVMHNITLQKPSSFKRIGTTQRKVKLHYE